MRSSTFLLCAFDLILILTPINAETINLYLPHYKNKLIKCQSDEDCTINCNGYDSCAFSTIQCPINHKCNLFCGDESNTCFHLFVNATYSSLFTLNGCSSRDLWTCSGMTIYFPPKDINGNIRSFINSGDNLNGYSQSLQFYAINGWNDIDTSRYYGTYSYFYGIMHCTHDYRKTCNFSDKSWSCQSTHDLCNNPFKYLSQSSSAESNKNSGPNSDSIFSDQTGILGFIVIIASVFICGWGILLVYHINKTFTLQKKSEINQRIENHHRDKSDSFVFKPIESKSNVEISKLKMNLDDSVTIAVNNNHNEISKSKTKSTSITHNNNINIVIPQNPIPIITDSNTNYHHNNSIFSLINYDSISSIPSIPSKHNEGHVQHIQAGDIIRNIINYSIKDIRINSIVSEDNKLMNKNTNSDIHEIAAILNENQTDENSSQQSSCLDEIEMEMIETNNSHNTSIQSVMFLYNSDMAIPEGTENEDETHENNNNNINNININNININNNNMLSPSIMPTTPKLTESFNLNVSPTPTLSDHDNNGLLLSNIGWPHTPKLPPSSNISNMSNMSNLSNSTTLTNMTYITASSVINNSYSDTESKNIKYKLNINPMNKMDTIEINSIEKTITQSCTMTTPICSTAKSDLDTNDNNNNNNNMNKWRTHEKNVSDTLIIEDDNNEDTSSWISDDNNKNSNSDENSDISNTEYDSNTTSMCSEMQQYFRKQVTEDDDEESINFGH